MANARELKERMASIQETRKITNAMYLISSSKVKQARKKLADTEPFFFGIQAEISRILRHVPDMHSHFFDIRDQIPPEERKIGCIVVTADNGDPQDVCSWRTGQTVFLQEEGPFAGHLVPVYGAETDVVQSPRDRGGNGVSV